MLRVGGYIFKRADTTEELEQIHRLNFRTFVNEIPQHPDPGTGRLIDKFHDKNLYFIAVRDGRVVAMVSSHDEPPFSVSDRLPDPDILRRPGTRPLEVRLLAVDPPKRNSTVFFGLLWSLYEHARLHGYTHLYISGFSERVPLYERLGFEMLGPAVRCGDASFVPMVLTVGRLPTKLERVKRLWETHVDLEGVEGPAENAGAARPTARREVCLLPGPVTVSPAVRQAFQQPPIYHRGPEFLTLFRRVRRVLGEMAGGRDVALFNGSGTLANEAVAAVLAADARPGCGVLLVNGEFGQRLARQAARFGLEPRLLSWPWGRPWDLDEIAAVLGQEPPGTWVWGVHQESSTGVLNDLPGLVCVARESGARVCVDCVSSLGAAPINLRGVYLATGATGKSLGAYAGLAIVFADAAALAPVNMGRVPSYFDIPAALASDGPRYTFPSATVQALEAALDEYGTPEKAAARYGHYAELGAYVRGELRRLGLTPLAAESYACPVVTTFAPPAGETSEALVERCRSWGYAIGGQSQYLAERRLVQVATMGAVGREDCAGLFERLGRWLRRRRQASPGAGIREPAPVTA
jgi:aspartate aminotransferase-like enzyme